MTFNERVDAILAKSYVLLEGGLILPFTSLNNEMGRINAKLQARTQTAEDIERAILISEAIGFAIFTASKLAESEEYVKDLTDG